MILSYYQIILPLPTSVNASHAVGRNRKGGKIIRSTNYNTWLQIAAIEYRNQFPSGLQKFTGRLRADYIFIWHEKDRGRNSSDISNREKVLSDFLEHKLFENDNQIDEQHHYRRIVKNGENRALCRIYKIPDRRFDDPNNIFNP